MYNKNEIPNLNIKRWPRSFSVQAWKNQTWISVWSVPEIPVDFSSAQTFPDSSKTSFPQPQVFAKTPFVSQEWPFSVQTRKNQTRISIWSVPEIPVDSS